MRRKEADCWWQPDWTLQWRHEHATYRDGVESGEIQRPLPGHFHDVALQGYLVMARGNIDRADTVIIQQLTKWDKKRQLTSLFNVFINETGRSTCCMRIRSSRLILKQASLYVSWTTWQKTKCSARGCPRFSEGEKIWSETVGNIYLWLFRFRKRQV